MEYRAPQKERNLPGYFHSVLTGGFNLKRNVWHVEDYVEGMTKAGFKNIKVHPIHGDPEYAEGKEEFSRFVEESHTFITADK